MLALAAGSYLAFASAATYPVVLTFSSRMPGQLTDPLEHLWLMKWSASCLLEGRSPFFCPGLNAPTGVPLGYFPTMHVQTLAFLWMGMVTENDVARFNVLWFSGFVATGLGTFVLSWWTVRRIIPAWIAGLGVMLCGPVMMHAHGHLETMQLGAVPLFLVAWIRFVEGPDRARLAGALGLYLVMVACAPYFAVLAVFPAAWFAGWSWWIAGGGARTGWAKDRAGWLMGFGAVALPGLAVLFSSQVWAAGHGHPMGRSRFEFDHLGAPIWSTFVPSPLHALGKLAAPSVFEATGYAGRMSECSSYLGVVTLGLLTYAAIRRVEFPRRGYWWSALGLMVVLSWGSSLDLGGTRWELPAGWIYGVFPPFHLIRVPARFNLFAAVCAAVPASAALADLWGRIGASPSRIAFAIACAGAMLADLSMIPFETATIPPMPKIYRDLAERNPDVGLVDAPMFGSNEGQVFSSLWGYWQATHHARTTAGYPGVPNVPFEAEVVRSSPFWAGRLLDPTYLDHPGLETFGPSEGVDPRDYAWLFLTAHRFDHVLLHRGTWTDAKYASGVERLERLFLDARSFEDPDVIVLDRGRIGAPDRLTWLCVEGFRPASKVSEGWSFGVRKSARIAVFQPTPDRPIVVELTGASAFGRPRVVRLMDGEREVARWSVELGGGRTLATPPIPLEGGLRELRLVSDGEDTPSRSVDRLDEARTSYSWRIRSVRLRDAANR